VAPPLGKILAEGGGTATAAADAGTAWTNSAAAAAAPGAAAAAAPGAVSPAAAAAAGRTTPGQVQGQAQANLLFVQQASMAQLIFDNPTSASEHALLVLYNVAPTTTWCAVYESPTTSSMPFVNAVLQSQHVIVVELCTSEALGSCQRKDILLVLE
jgi:hypothetical protein